MAAVAAVVAYTMVPSRGLPPPAHSYPEMGQEPGLEGDAGALPSFDPYTAGYEDALANRPRRYADGAFSHCTAHGGSTHGGDAAAQAQASGGGFGIMKMMSMAAAGSTVYRLGGTPWNPQTVIANLQADPKQGIIILVVAYGLIS